MAGVADGDKRFGVDGVDQVEEFLLFFAGRHDLNDLDGGGLSPAGEEGGAEACPADGICEGLAAGGGENVHDDRANRDFLFHQ